MEKSEYCNSIYEQLNSEKYFKADFSLQFKNAKQYQNISRFKLLKICFIFC